MTKNTISQTVKDGKILFSDGACGTFLQKKGLKPGQCPELWNIQRPDDVLDVAKAYADAGSDMIETNSFGATSFKLAHYNLENKVTELNTAAAEICRQAIADKGWVLGSIGPTGKMLVMGDVTDEDLYKAFKQQAMALETGGADAACVETMSALDEACLAIKAVKENTSLEIIATMTFEKTVQGDYKTMMGVSPETAAPALLEAGADIIGTNCGNGIAGMIEIVKIMRTVASSAPIIVHANAGLPENIDGKDVFPETPEDMANQLKDLVAAGANIIGGCCGTTPEHISAMKAVKL